MIRNEHVSTLLDSVEEQYMDYRYVFSKHTA